MAWFVWMVVVLLTMRDIDGLTGVRPVDIDSIAGRIFGHLWPFSGRNSHTVSRLETVNDACG